jgi:hypothetical protein
LGPVSIEGQIVPHPFKTTMSAIVVPTIAVISVAEFFSQGVFTLQELSVIVPSTAGCSSLISGQNLEEPSVYFYPKKSKYCLIVSNWPDRRGIQHVDVVVVSCSGRLQFCARQKYCMRHFRPIFEALPD